MSEKKDREVRKLFSIANTTALEMLDDSELSDLTPQEIFIGSCKLAVEAGVQELPKSYPLAELKKDNVAFMLDQNDAIIIMGDEQFEQSMQDLDVGTDVDED